MVLTLLIIIHITMVEALPLTQSLQLIQDL